MSKEGIRQRVTHILSEHGLVPNGGSIHGWRCEYPDRYPEECNCVDDLVDDILNAFN